MSLKLKNKQFYTILPTAVFSAAFLIAMFTASVLAPVNITSADTVAATLNNAGYNISVSSSDRISVNLATTPDGVVATAKDTITIQSNIASGYKLYFGMANSTTNSLYKDGNTTSSAAIAATNGTYNVPAVLGMNTWGYAVPGLNNFDSSYSTDSPNLVSLFAKVPLGGSEDLIYQQSTTTDKSLDVYYAVKANTALPSGTYYNNVAYTAVSTDDSASDIASVSPSTTEKLEGGEQLSIATNLNIPASSAGAVNVTVGGKTCTNVNSVNSESGQLMITCLSPSHSSGHYDVSIEIPNYNKNYFIANAIEYIAKYQTLEDIKFMQDITPEICTNTSVHTSATLTDIRDGNTYEVRKLKDGNCWMVQNLKLDLSTNRTLTSDTTDLNSKTSWLPNNNTQEVDGVDWGLYDLQSSIDTTRSYHNDEYGNLYNYYAATAASGDYSAASGNSPDSICPKGWGLPENESTSTSWGGLLKAYSLEKDNAESINLIQEYPISLLLGGYYLQDANTSTTDPNVLAAQGRVYNQGKHGHFWSRSVRNNQFVYYLYINIGNTGVPRLRTDGTHRKAGGRSIRCVSPGKTISSITTMQDLTPQICASTPTPVAVKGDGTINTDVPETILTDIRDGNTYRIRKLADGNCWMTENLRLSFADVDGDGIVGVKSADGTRETSMDSTNTDLNSRAFWAPTVATQTTTGTLWGSNGSAGTTGNKNDQYAAVEHSYWDDLTLQDGDGNTQPRGSYYNWYTATAMSGTWSIGASGTENAPDSICPKGWQLPASFGNKSFQNLAVATYGLLSSINEVNSAARDKLTKDPFSYLYSGSYYWITGDISSSSYLIAWTSEAHSATSVWTLRFDSSGSVNLQNDNFKPNGFSIRCVLR